MTRQREILHSFQPKDALAGGMWITPPTPRQSDPQPVSSIAASKSYRRWETCLSIQIALVPNYFLLI